MYNHCRAYANRASPDSLAILYLIFRSFAETPIRFWSMGFFARYEYKYPIQLP